MAKALTAIEPFQPIPGIPARENHARAHEYYEQAHGKVQSKLSRTNQALEALAGRLRSEVERGKVVAVDKFHRGAKTAKIAGVHAGTSIGVAGFIGLCNGRFGGDKGYAERWGIPLDGALLAAGALGAVASFLFTKDTPEAPSEHLLTHGLVALSSGGAASFVGRNLDDLGVAWKHRSHGSDPAAAGATAAANGARGGVVYPMPHAK